MESLPKGDLIGLLAVMRLDAANREIEDYVLLPAPLRSGRYVWLSSDSLRRRQGALTRKRFGAIKARLAKTNRAAPTSSAPSKKRSKSGRPKAKGFGGRRSRCGDTRPLR